MIEDEESLRLPYEKEREARLTQEENTGVAVRTRILDTTKRDIYLDVRNAPDPVIRVTHMHADDKSELYGKLKASPKGGRPRTV